MRVCNNREVGEIVENEGLGYAVQHYMAAEAIKDPEVAKLWKAAGAAMDNLEKHLRDELGVIE